MTFDDLIFKPHPLSSIKPGAVQALQQFHNNYTISVVGGPDGCGLYGDGVETFEVAIFQPDGEFYIPDGGDSLDAVVGYLTKEEVTKIIHNIQKRK